MDDLKEAELKHEALRELLDQLHGQTSSFLSFTLKWKDLDTHLELAKKSLLKQAQDLALQEKIVMERDKNADLKLERLEQSLDELQRREKRLAMVNLKLRWKEKQLNLVQKEVEDCNGKLCFETEKLQLVKRKIEECDMELDAKEKQLDMVQKSVNEMTEEIELKERKLCLVEKRLEECCKEIDVKNEQLGSVKMSLEECYKELEINKGEVEKVKWLVKDCNSDLQLKAEELEKVKNLIGDCNGECDLKKKELGGIQQSIDECIKEFDMKRKELDRTQKMIDERMNELGVKETELSRIQKLLEESSKDVDSKEKNLVSIKLLIEQNTEKLVTVEKQHDAIKKSVTDYRAELKSKEVELGLIGKSVEEQLAKLLSGEKKLDYLQMCVKRHAEELELKEKSIVQCSKEYESKQKDLDLVSKSLDECCDELKSKKSRLDSLKKISDECLQMLATKERQFGERIKKFELKEQQFHSLKKSVEERCKAVDLKEKQLYNILISQARREQSEHLMTNGAVDSLSTSLQCCIKENGRNLQLLLNEHLRKCPLVCDDLSAALQKSPDPIKFVLDAVQGFYPPGLKKGDTELELTVIRQHCTTLLEQLLKISPQIKPEQREEAMKLAYDWKTKMRAVSENSLEVLGFLQLLAAFKLVSDFSADELRSLLSTIAHHRQATQLRQALGIEDNLVGRVILCPQLKTEQPEHLQVSSSNADQRSWELVLNKCLAVHNLMQEEVLDALQLSPDPAKFALDVMQEIYSLCQENEVIGFDASMLRAKIVLLEQLMKVSPKVSPQVKEAAVSTAVLWKENIKQDSENYIEVLAFLMFLDVYGLASSFRGEEILSLLEIIAQMKQAPYLFQALGFTNMIPYFIQKLMERKQYIGAARFTCAFGLVNMFPLAKILKECLENIKKDACISTNGNKSLEAQDEAIVKEVAALRAILECVTDYKLESRFETKYILDRIAELEKKRAAKGDSIGAPILKDQHRMQVTEYHTIGISGASHQAGPAPKFQQRLRNPNLRGQLQLQCNNKRPRLDLSIHGYNSP